MRSTCRQVTHWKMPHRVADTRTMGWSVSAPGHFIQGSNNEHQPLSIFSHGSVRVTHSIRAAAHESTARSTVARVAWHKNFTREWHSENFTMPNFTITIEDNSPLLNYDTNWDAGSSADDKASLYVLRSIGTNSNLIN